jgi:peptidoglycan/xylan/chitin deacetylase (PgdA/CDA1 family)
VALIALVSGLLIALAGYGASPGVAHTPSVRTPKATGPGTPLTLPAVLPSRSVRVPILMYHRIDRQTAQLSALTRGLTVTPSAFAAEMQWLVAHGFHAIGQQQLFAALFQHVHLPSRPVLITFDDGYRDVFKNALPILERLQLRATAYIITGRVSGPDPSFLTWHQVVTMSHHGIDIGSHTVTHRPLTYLTPTQTTTELAASRTTLEKQLGRPVQWFAYPYGYFNAAITSAVRKAGYVLAVTTQGGLVQDAGQPLALHRFEVRGNESLPSFAALLDSSLATASKQ